MERVVQELIKYNKTISTMESCTGGAIVNAITNIPNASCVIKFSAITYANEFKIKMGVHKELIDKYSVYSMEVAHSMAYNISHFTESNYGVGVTGKLKKQDPNNPFGNNDIVYLSIYDKDNDKYYDEEIKLCFDTRMDNKSQIIEVFIRKILEII